MQIYKITEASEYPGISINTLKTLANSGGGFHSEESRKVVEWWTNENQQG